MCQQQSKALPLEQIMDNPHYKATLDRAYINTTNDEKQEQIQKHAEELSQLYAFRREWEENVTVSFAFVPKLQI